MPHHPAYLIPSTGRPQGTLDLFSGEVKRRTCSKRLANSPRERKEALRQLAQKDVGPSMSWEPITSGQRSDATTRIPHNGNGRWGLPLSFCEQSSGQRGMCLRSHGF